LTGKRRNNIIQNVLEDITILIKGKMNSQMININKIGRMSPYSTQDYCAWINVLGGSNKAERMQAIALIKREGEAVIPVLIQTLSTGATQIRLQVARLLTSLRVNSAAPALVKALEDDDHDVRWAAMKGLIGLGRSGLEPLLLALQKDFDSVWLREGAHHILHMLKNQGSLRQPSLDVLQALEGLEPEVAVPMAAERAWESLFGPEKKERR
jgi:hypothetical protein